MFSRKNSNGVRKLFYETSSGGYSLGMHNTSSCHYQTTFFNKKKQAIVSISLFKKFNTMHFPKFSINL